MSANKQKNILIMCFLYSFDYHFQSFVTFLQYEHQFSFTTAQIISKCQLHVELTETLSQHLSSYMNITILHVILQTVNHFYKGFTLHSICIVYSYHILYVSNYQSTQQLRLLGGYISPLGNTR